MARPFCAAEAEAVCEIPFPWDGPVRTPVCPARIPDLCLGLSSDRPANDFIFSLTGREPISDNIRRNGWEKFQRETGISCTLHQLRHAYASLLYESGVDEKTAQKLMGHSDITTTLRIYTHLRDQHLKISQDIFRSFLDSK